MVINHEDMGHQLKKSDIPNEVLDNKENWPEDRDGMEGSDHTISQELEYLESVNNPGRQSMLMAGDIQASLDNQDFILRMIKPVLEDDPSI